MNSCTLEGYAVSAPHVASIVLFLLQRSIEFASVSTIFRIDFENNDIFVEDMSHIICTIQKVFWKCSFGDLKKKICQLRSIIVHGSHDEMWNFCRGSPKHHFYKAWSSSSKREVFKSFSHIEIIIANFGHA